MEKNSATLEIIWFFHDFKGESGEDAEVNQVAQNCLILKVNFG